MLGWAAPAILLTNDAGELMDMQLDKRYTHLG